MIDLSNLTVCNEPFQFGTATEVFDEEFYRDLVESFPPVVLAQRTGTEKYGIKYSIAPEAGSEKKQFYAFLDMAPAWKKFHDHVISGSWLKYFDLPIRDYYARFEFSFLPWEDGILFPHRDAPPKVLALVFPMTLEEHPEWGGSTEMMEPKQKYDLLGAIEPFEKFNAVLKAPFRPNSANFLVRSDNSWHGVRCHGPKGEFRKSITLNLVGEGYAKATEAQRRRWPQLAA